MRAAGIGYALFLEVDVGVPRGRVDLLGPEWRELHAHAIREAERLGIQIIMGSGPGWAGSGGPWVTPQQSMAHLVASSTDVRGPARFDRVLPVPVPRRPFLGDNTLSPGLRRIRDAWYEDVAVLAFPTPAAKRTIESVDEKALDYRAPYTSQAGVAPFIPAPASCVETPDAAIRQDQIIDLTSRLEPGGRLRWDAPPGGWAMVHIDSWEMGAQNWTADFRQEFERRRGYDPLRFLPVYTGLIVGGLRRV